MTIKEKRAPRNCGLFLTEDNVIEVRKAESGGYVEGEPERAVAMAKAMVEAKLPVSFYAVWNDRTDAPPEKRKTNYTAAQFAALVKGQSLTIQWCERTRKKDRRKFWVPVLKIGNATPLGGSTGTRTASNRIGE